MIPECTHGDTDEDGDERARDAPADGTGADDVGCEHEVRALEDRAVEE